MTAAADAPNASPLARQVTALFWGAIAIGLTLPTLVSLGHEVAARDRALAQAWQDYRLYLFAPGYNYFLVAVLNAAPFFVLALFLLFHLGTAHRHGRAVVSRRLAGVLGAGLVAVGLSAWLHLSLTLHPDAQGAIALFFLPLYVLLLMPAGYGCGRFLRRLAAP